MKIYLASTSKRRIEILGEILKPFNKKFEISDPDFSEKDGGYPPGEIVLINARGKAKSIAMAGKCLIIGADTIVVLDGRILGKPGDAAQAKEYLEMLAGRTHSVFTGVAVYNPDTQRCYEGVSKSEVTFQNLTPHMIDRYISACKPFDKAGGYGIQELGDDFIRKISGSYSNIVGLPEDLTLDLLLKAGLSACLKD